MSETEYETYEVAVDGQTIELPAEQCKTDKTLRDALVPFYPGVANSDVKRDGRRITVTKRAGSKGAAASEIAAALDAAPETISPVILLALSSRRVSRAEEERALKFAGEEVEAVARARTLLDEAAPSNASTVPVGF